MVQFESTVKHIPYSQERVYNKLSDLSNLESVRDRLDMINIKSTRYQFDIAHHRT